MGVAMCTPTTNFHPPYCPHDKCLNFKQYSGKFYALKGTLQRKDGSPNKRYLCKSCKKTFSESTFKINYRYRKRGHYNFRIFFGLVHNRSNRSIARELKISESTVRGRLIRLSRFALLRHYDFLSKIDISEPVAYDGLEAFARSQYEPCNINQAVGSESLFCYLFNYAPMNRKGRMSKRQKIFLHNLEQEEGRFNPKAIRITTKLLFKELVARKSSKIEQLTIKTDEHFQYQRALNRDLTKSEHKRIHHISVSSKKCRNYKNVLFPVNHLDLLIRRKVAAYSRETICFSKTAARMVHKYILYICYKNYMKPRFVKKHKTDTLAHVQTPAMKLGLCTKQLKFAEFFIQKPINKSELPLDWSHIMQDKTPFERSKRFLKN